MLVLAVIIFNCMLKRTYQHPRGFRDRSAHIPPQVPQCSAEEEHHSEGQSMLFHVQHSEACTSSTTFVRTTRVTVNFDKNIFIFFASREESSLWDKDTVFGFRDLSYRYRSARGLGQSIVPSMSKNIHWRQESVVPDVKWIWRHRSITYMALPATIDRA